MVELVYSLADDVDSLLDDVEDILEGDLEDVLPNIDVLLTLLINTND